MHFSGSPRGLSGGESTRDVTDIILSDLDEQEAALENENDVLYECGTLTLCEGYKAIRTFVIKCNLAFTQVLLLISLLFYLLPNGHKLRRLCIVNSLRKREDFIYETVCVFCHESIDPLIGDCQLNCPLNAFIVYCNKKSGVNYPKRAHVLLPNDMINGLVYKQLHINVKHNPLTLMLHADGMNIITTKLKKFYVVSATIVELPPPLREYSRNKLLLHLYLSDNEPTAAVLFDRLTSNIKEFINRDHLNIMNHKFQLRFQGLKADLPCRALYYACSNCLQRGEVLGDGNTIVYYPYERNQLPRTHLQFTSACTQAQLNNGALSIEGLFGKTPLLDLSFDIRSNFSFDYMHLSKRNASAISKQADIILKENTSPSQQQSQATTTTVTLPSIKKEPNIHASKISNIQG
ncbi:unnamed protein product [Didymodactylos carnosus]|uniref:Uncharacterized protein n=1 Tax=Didymodactylos carnosus TaxID=1234261 RepID=A0A8S2FLC8_9BILA|nr:unnamed protein product [Didymodactylos carnosus]CAF4286765.1 unnamed protein product [Didymodactylos carnosus]